MRKLLSILLLFICLTGRAQYTQHSEVDNLKQQLAAAKSDTAKIRLLNNLYGFYIWSYPDSSLPYVQQEYLLASKLNMEDMVGRAYGDYGLFYLLIGDFPQALHYRQQVLRTVERINNPLYIAIAYDGLADVYSDEGDYRQALAYEIRAKQLLESGAVQQEYKTRNPERLKEAFMYVLNGLASIYERANQLDSALKYIGVVKDLYTELNGKMDWPPVPFAFGNIYLKLGRYTEALQQYHQGIAFADAGNNRKDLMDSYNGLAKTFSKIAQLDSAAFYANKVLEVSRMVHYPIVQLDALRLLAEVYKSRHQVDSSNKYLELTLRTKDSLFNQQRLLQMQNMTFNEQVRQQEAQKAQQTYRNKIKTYALLTGLFVFFTVAILLWRNNQHKQKANTLLQQQKQTIEHTLAELKATQAQLIQSEKMASLGELTAGIAHEIQNPLNFVNNFAEINTELVQELKQENRAVKPDQVETIAGEIEQNLQKIVHHGRRAEAIVKSMLEHSRTSKGEKQPTDLNALVDEYLRLAYHGYRAKDKNFNVTMQTQFDESIGKVNLIPQEIGRVLLNIFNNAFYAVNERAKQAGEGYAPTVTVNTIKGRSEVLISVKDNGIGIPPKVVDKIFQPFFTTKPTGEGTGLGLSLSYDIVKAHGGELKVESKEGEGSEFVIQFAF